MSIFDRFKGVFTRSQKESQARMAMVIGKVGDPISTPANYEGFAKVGYSKNVVVYTAIAKIAQACAGVNWTLYSKNGSKLTEISEHPLLKLLERPNPLQSKSEFIESVVGFRCIAGNSYIEENLIGKKVTELWPARPDKITVVPNARGYVQKYLFKNGGVTREWDVDQVSLRSSLLHWKTFNPLNDWYGQSALQAAIQSLDINNQGQKWNLSLLQNSATPSGVLQMNATQANPRGSLTDEQFKRVQEQIEQKYQGAKNTGRPMVLEGGLTWQQISMSPKEMEFLKSKDISAVDILMAMGVPPEIVGLGIKTYNNYREARLSFYEDTVLPTMDSLRDSLNYWLVPMFGENLYLDYDRDAIEALQYRREQRYTSLANVKFLTYNEKREQCGYDEIEGGDVLDDGGGLETDSSDDGSEENIDNNINKNPKPTNTNDNEDENVDEDINDEDDKSHEWKTINLLNANEKRQSWKRQNRKRKNLEVSFNQELKEDFRDLTKHLEKVAASLKGADPKVIELALVKACDDLNPQFAKTIRRHVKYTLEVFGQNVLRSGKSLYGVSMAYKEGKSSEYFQKNANTKYDQYVEDYIVRATGNHIKTITSTNERAVKRIVKEWTATAIQDGDSTLELSKYLEAEFEGLTPGRARTIARTEVSSASSNGALGAAKSLGIPGLVKEWVSSNDDRSRDGSKGGPDHLSANGQRVPLDEKFTIPPDASMDCPGDDAGGADQVINCRCVQVFSQRGE